MKQNRFQQRAFLLIFALLLTVLITIIALGILGARRGNYSASVAIVNSVHARSLARSGMDDIWTKLSNDPFFPTGIGDEQTQFSYLEEVRDSTGKEIGTYAVKVDRQYRAKHEVVLIESTGMTGGLTSKNSTFTIYAELSTGSGDFRFKVWQEGTSPKL